MNKQTTDIHKYWVDTILTEASDGLTDWEKNFISDMKIRLDNSWPLTDYQEAKLEQIYTAKTS